MSFFTISLVRLSHGLNPLSLLCLFLFRCEGEDNEKFFRRRRLQLYFYPPQWWRQHAVRRRAGDSLCSEPHWYQRSQATEKCKRLSKPYQYECSYNKIPRVQYADGCKYDMIPEVQCEYNPPHWAVWVWQRFSPAAHMENSREEERWVQFQRQRPAGKWTAPKTERTLLKLYLHGCRFVCWSSWPLHFTLETGWGQNPGNFPSGCNFP